MDNNTMNKRANNGKTLYGHNCPSCGGALIRHDDENFICNFCGNILGKEDLPKVVKDSRTLKSEEKAISDYQNEMKEINIRMKELKRLRERDYSDICYRMNSAEADSYFPFRKRGLSDSMLKFKAISVIILAIIALVARCLGERTDKETKSRYENYSGYIFETVTEQND